MAVAGYMKQKMLCHNSWLIERLGTATEYLVSRYVSDDSKWGQGRCKKAFRKANRKVEDLTLLHPFLFGINETYLR